VERFKDGDGMERVRLSDGIREGMGEYGLASSTRGYGSKVRGEGKGERQMSHVKGHMIRGVLA
jgi:hypothetical protein